MRSAYWLALALLCAGPVACAQPDPAPCSQRWQAHAQDVNRSEVWLERELPGCYSKHYLDPDDAIDTLIDSAPPEGFAANDTIWFADGATGIVVLTADMNGDGRGDLLANRTGGVPPTAFLPGLGGGAYMRASIPVCTADVTGDGVKDWVYSSSGKPCGRRGEGTDAFYDPVTTMAGFRTDMEASSFPGLLLLAVLLGLAEARRR